MRLSSVSLLSVLLFATYSVLAQHSSGGSSSSGSSSSGGGSHSSSSSSSSGSSGASSSSGGSHSSGGGSSYSGGGIHSSGGSHGSGSSHSASGGGHSSPGGRASGNTSVNRGSGSNGKNDRGSSFTTTTRNRAGNSNVSRSIHEPRIANPQRTIQPEKRGFFSRVFHPFRKPQPKPEPRPALYLPRPICPHGRCAMPCPTGQVHRGGSCSAPVIQACVSGQIWNGNLCGYNRHYHCPIGETWNGINCVQATNFLDNCVAERAQLRRQMKRVQAAESMRQSVCGNGITQECSQATSDWQGEENIRQNLFARYQQCQAQSGSYHNGAYYPSFYDSTLWFDSLHFNTDF